MERFTLTVVTSNTPPILSNQLELGEDGEIQVHDGEPFLDGTCEKKSPDLGDFAKLLKSLTPANALSYGHNSQAPAQSNNQESGENIGHVPLTAGDLSGFEWPDGAGVLRLDLDGSASRQKWLEDLYSVWPELERHPHVWWASSSSCVYRTSEKKDITKEIEGQRLYVPVQNARDIPRAGDVLFEKLWLSGFGRFEVSRTGMLLERSIIDASVWNPGALDLCGSAVCGEGLKQKRPDPVIHNADAPFIDTKTLANLDPNDKEKLKSVREKEASLLKDNVARAQELWVGERTEAAREKVATDTEGESSDKNHLTDIFTRAVKNHQLLADYELRSEQYGPVTVQAVLEDPTKFHDTCFADPLEPDNEIDIARAYLKVARTPYLHSRVHGGIRYKLVREIPTIAIHPGQFHTVIDECLKMIRTDGVVYDCGGKLGRVTKDGTLPVSAAWLRVYLNKLAQFRRFDSKHPDGVFVNCPSEVAHGILALTGDWGVPSLRGILKAPTMDLDGRIIDLDGFDEATGIYLDFPDAAQWSDIPLHLTDDQIQEAIEFIWRPFRDFPFVTSVDQGVLLAAILTAPVQPLLPTTPAFAIVAPVAASGKTLLAKCIAILAGDETPAMLPPAENEELRKRMFAFARSGKRVMVLDNVVGAIESDALCAFITAEYTADRVLGFSTMGVRPANAMIVLTGNNIFFVGDLNRRVLKAEIDPAIERPYVRRFDQDPQFYVQQNRVAMVRAILTVLLAFKRSGIKMVDDSMASFEAWSDLIRQTVIWIGQRGWLNVGDPGESITTSYEEDPELNKLRALISTWQEMFGTNSYTVRAAMDKVARKKSGSDSNETDPKVNALYEAMLNITEERGQINPRKLGWWIKQHSKRVVSGMRFIEHRKRGNSCSWSVDSVA